MSGNSPLIVYDIENYRRLEDGSKIENFASTRGFVTPPNGKSWPDS